MRTALLCLVAGILFVLGTHVCSSSSSDSLPRGVDPKFAASYVKSDHFVCLDQSRTLPWSSVNDEDCECPDGSDEPGTSACAGLDLDLRFYCPNEGYLPLRVHSSKVDDGLCDCCDGSDEPKGRCINTCQEEGRVYREERERIRKLHQQGYAIRQETITQAKTERESKQSKIEELRKRIESLSPLLNQYNDRIEALEKEQRLERELKEVEENTREILERQARRAQEPTLFNTNSASTSPSAEDSVNAPSDSSTQVENPIVDVSTSSDHTEESKLLMPEVSSSSEHENPAVDMPVPEPSEDAVMPSFEGSSTVEDHTESTGSHLPSAEDDARKLDELVQKSSDLKEELNQVRRHFSPTNSPSGADTNGTDHDRNLAGRISGDSEPIKDSSGSSSEKPSIWSRVASWFSSLGGSSSNDSTNDADERSVLQEMKKRRDSLQSDRSSLESEISSAEDFLRLDLGPDGEFFDLYKSCFEYKTNEYTYELCPFDRAAQNSRHGHGSSNLGRWGKWDGSEDASRYSRMLYEGGDSCWQGPNRSTAVEMRCGNQSRLVHIDEPSRCVYLFVLETPGACSAELQDASM